MISVQCPCGLSIRLQDDLAGKKVRCPRCAAVHLLTPMLGVGMLGARSARSDDDDDDRVTHKPKSRRPTSRDDDDDDRPSKKRLSGADAPASSGMATFALVCGLGTCCLPGILMWPAIILGIIAITQINGSNGQLTGMGKAVTGLIFGLVGNIIGVGIYCLIFLVIVPLIFVGAIGGAVVVADQALKTETKNNLKLIGVGIHQHHEAKQSFPSQSTPNGLSWRVSVLPYVDQDPLYRRFDMKSNWDAPQNRLLQNQRPPIYQSKVSGVFDQQRTSYQSTIGPNGLYRNKDEKLTTIGVPDGTSNTIFAFDAPRDHVVWTQAADLQIDNARPLPNAIQPFGGQTMTYSVIMLDGSVKTISRPKINDDVLRKLIDPRDGAAINPAFD
jgi:hypothetical protein